MAFVGQLTGKAYDSKEAMLHYERLEARRRAPRNPADELLDRLTPEQIRELDTRSRLSDEQKVLQQQTGVDLQVFFAEHPEYDDCPENAGAMKFYLEGRGINTQSGLVNYHQIEQAYRELCEGGFLKLKKDVLRQQEAQTVRNRGAAIKAQRTPFDEDAAYEMSMDELRQRASGAHD
jgi:hypothetical protein